MQCLETSIDRHAWVQTAPEKFRAMARLDDLTAFLRLCPAYEPSPLIDAPAFARDLGVGSLSLKDETNRMGLGAFKSLGGAYAIINMMLTRAESERGAPLPIDAQLLDALKPFAKNMTFCCASAGNHGMSVTAGAKLTGAKALIYLADSVPEDFAKRLEAKGAEVRREGADYDASMEAARTACDAHGWTLISDSSWPGYEDIPLAIMKGYAAMSDEIAAQSSVTGDWPTHVFLQGGVGGLAAGLANHIRLTWAEQPAIIIVEPGSAACLLESMRAGKPLRIDARDSNMGRLDCAEPSMLAFEILQNAADAFVTVSNDEAESAVATLKSTGLATTPSGAAGYTGLVALAGDQDMRNQFGLDENTRALCVVTECALSE